MCIDTLEIQPIVRNQEQKESEYGKLIQSTRMSYLSSACHEGVGSALSSHFWEDNEKRKCYG